MNFFHSLNHLYLSLLPALTYPVMATINTNSNNGWYNLLFFFAVILYIPLVNQYTILPKTLIGSFISTIAVPIQIFLALHFGNFGNIWLLFAYQFLIQIGGILIGFILAGLFGQFGKRQIKFFGTVFFIPNLKQFFSLFIFAIPIFAIISLLGPFFSDVAWSWPTFFLFTALMTAANQQFVQLKNNETASQDPLENIAFIVLGFIALITLGPMLGQFFGEN